MADPNLPQNIKDAIPGQSSGTIAVGPTVVPGTGATNLGKAEDSPHTSGDVGVEVLAVRNDAGGPLANDGDYIPFTTDSTGALRVTVGSGGGVQYPEDQPAVSGDLGNMALAVRNDTDAVKTSLDGDYSAISVDSAGRVKVAPLPTGANVIGALTANQSVNTAQINGVAPSMGNGVSGVGVQRVTLASDSTGQVALAAGTTVALAAGAAAIGSVGLTTSATATVAQVASSAANVTLQAANAARKGLTIFNDSNAALSVKFGATASATSFTVRIAAGGYWEMPIPAYSGIVDGIWASANGFAYVTEW